jgi:hypothetical protein
LVSIIMRRKAMPRHFAARHRGQTRSSAPTFKYQGFKPGRLLP